MKNIFTLSNIEKIYLIYSFSQNDIQDNRIHIGENGNVFIDDYDSISEEEYEKISKYMKRLGYDWRGAEDAKELLMRDVYSKKGYWDDLAEAILNSLGIKAEIPNKDRKEHVELDAKSIFRKAKRKFGVTNNFNLAGWLLPDGSLLNFSAEGYQRDLDHREIVQVDDSLNDMSSGMIQFMNLGAIRLGPVGKMNYGFINISDTIPPTSRQYSILREFISNLNEEIYVQINGPSGNEITSKEFKNTNQNIVIQQIKMAIKNGEFQNTLIGSDFR